MNARTVYALWRHADKLLARPGPQAAQSSFEAIAAINTASVSRPELSMRTHTALPQRAGAYPSFAVPQPYLPNSICTASSQVGVPSARAQARAQSTAAADQAADADTAAASSNTQPTSGDAPASSAKDPAFNITEEDQDMALVDLSIHRQNLQGNKRLSRADKRARKLARKGVDRVLTHRTVSIPAEVTVDVIGTQLFFAGPLGSNALDLLKVDSRGMTAFKAVKDASGKVTELCFVGPDERVIRSCHTHVSNQVHGVLRGYLMYMQLAGVGYRVSKSTRDVTFNVSDR